MEVFLLLLILLAAFALVWWGINALSLPNPVKVVVLVFIGLLALAFVYKLVVSGRLGSLPF